jgi:hypothetical protein
VALSIAFCSSPICVVTLAWSAFTAALPVAPVAEIVFGQRGERRRRGCVGALGCGEDAIEVLLGLADVLRDDGRQVDPVQLEAELVASTCAAIVLPVPDSAANIAFRP